MLELRTFLISPEPLRITRHRYAQSLRHRFAIPRFAGKTVRVAHVLLERGRGASTILDERYPLVRFDARGHATRDDDFLDLCAAAVGVRVPDRAPMPPVLESRPGPAVRAWKPDLALRSRIIAAVYDDDDVAA